MIRIKKRHIFTAILVLLFMALLTYYVEKSFSFRLTELENYIASFGPWIPVLLLIVIIITSSIGFVFMIPVAIAALLLNPYVAFFISILGLTLGAAISFFAARYFGRSYFERKFRSKISKLDSYEKGFAHKDFLRIILLRLISLVPYEIINIGAGLSRIKFLPFILATLAGIIPGIIITIYFIKSTQNIFSAQFLFATALMLGFSLLPLLSRNVRKIVFNLE